MKVSELKRILEHANDDNEVMISIELPYTTVGARPMVAVKSVMHGFDWEHGKFIMRPEENLTPADRDFAKQMKDMQDKWGWADYENRNLKAEIKRLKKRLEVNQTDNVRAGAEIHSGDGGYTLGTQEDYEAFAKQRNYKIPGDQQ